ncbi:MAG: hypothetical protein FWF91_05115 [Coriobacteriia bacterium]|nr:hypothetical protein [Coriobacteriia bacterium]
MPQIDIHCSQCRSGEYELLDAKTGEVVCRFCRNKWIVPELIQKSETEKFLEEQAKQPRVIYDNTTETDKQLMDLFGKMLNFNPLRSISRFFRNLIGFAVAVVVLFVVALFIMRLSGFNFMSGLFG